MSYINVSIRTDNNTLDAIVEPVKALFKEHIPDKEIAWEKDWFSLHTHIPTNENTIMTIFNIILEKYPQAELYAKYSYDVREDDYSADWWGVTTIETEVKDGKKVLTSSSATYWN